MLPQCIEDGIRGELKVRLSARSCDNFKPLGVYNIQHHNIALPYCNDVLATRFASLQSRQPSAAETEAQPSPSLPLTSGDFFQRRRPCYFLL